MTTAQLFISAAKTSLNDVKTLTRKAWSLFLFTFVFTLACTEFFLEFQEMAGQNEWIHFTSQIGLMLCTLLEAAILIMIIPHMVAGQLDEKVDTVWSLFFRNNKVFLVDLMIEGLRVLVIVLLWALALILPGLWMQIRLSFVPLTVLLDKRYQAADIDALKESKALSQGITAALLALTLAFYAVDFLLESVIRKYDLLIDPVVPLAFSILSFGLQIWWTAFFTRIYLLRRTALIS